MVEENRLAANLAGDDTPAESIKDYQLKLYYHGQWKP